MRTLTPHEKRTVRWALIGIALYLGLFFGWRSYGHLERRRVQYQELVRRAEIMRVELGRLETKLLLIEKLQSTFHIDLGHLTNASLVAVTSTAIQNAARSGGIQLGPIRESPARAAARELSSMQMEGAGPVEAITTWLSRLQSLGYPLVVDSVQITPEANKPGAVKLSMTVVILDYEQWKIREEPSRG